MAAECSFVCAAVLCCSGLDIDVCSSVLQFDAVFCSVLHIDVCCNVLHVV